MTDINQPVNGTMKIIKKPKNMSKKEWESKLDKYVKQYKRSLKNGQRKSNRNDK